MKLSEGSTLAGVNLEDVEANPPEHSPKGSERIKMGESSKSGVLHNSILSYYGKYTLAVRDFWNMGDEQK